MLLVKLIEPPCTERYARWCERSGNLVKFPSYSIAILMDSGIKRADIKKPVFTEIPKGSVAVLKKCTVPFGGVEDE